MNPDEPQPGADHAGVPLELDSARRKIRVLIVEDEIIIAMVTEDMLADLGYEIVGPVDTVETATQMIDAEPFDIALVDLNLHGKPSFALADTLAERRIPFAFATGASRVADDRHAGVPLLIKPFDLAALQSIVEQLVACLPAPGSGTGPMHSNAI